MGPGDLLTPLWDVVMPPNAFNGIMPIGSDVVAVNYVPPVDSGEADTYGLYVPPQTPSGRPMIRIFRDAASLPTPRHRPDGLNPQQDACTLAHEYGHHLSRSGRHRAPSYERAVSTALVDWPRLSDADKTAIFDEEARAWNFGRIELDKLGCDDWAAFEGRRHDGLANYRRFLGLP